ncbi:MAG: DUF1311 domain-containing protein [Clostridiales bacterium]|nr:DUF1311 domain-containing protein [Clostridiales bacterium]
MKKSVFMLILVIAFFTTSCVSEEAKTPLVDINVEDSVSFLIENVNSEDKSLDDYMALVKGKSDVIKNSLGNDALTQTDMNIKSQELYELWDETLNYLWSKLKNSLSEEEFAKLKNQQRIWIAEKEKAIEEAGKEFEGGSIYSLVVNGEATRITEERVYELYELIKE